MGGGRSARADLITYDFAGSIVGTTGVNASVPTDVVVGQGFTGTLTYEDSTPAGSLGTLNGQYYHIGAVRELTVQIGSAGYSLASVLSQNAGGTQQAVILANDFPVPGGLQDQFSADGYSYDYSVASHNKYTVLSLDLYEKSPNPTALSSNTLPGTILDLAKFTTIAAISFQDLDTNSLTGGVNSNLAFQGNLTSLQLRSVPEPSSIALFGLGGFALSLLAWRRRSAD